LEKAIGGTIKLTTGRAMSNGEDQITAWFAKQRRLSAKDFPIGIGDDMAEVRIAGDKTVLITTDMMLDGVHFDLNKTTLRRIGYKAMAVNLSDCAAMATIPVAAVAAVALPKGFGQKELKELHKGIAEAADKYNCPLVGGDITCWRGREPFAINIAMISRRAANKPVRRFGAKVGDCICVTGSLGGSLYRRHLAFEPRVREALKITEIVTLHSMIDLSDGLSSDLNRICDQSRVGAVVDSKLIPISKDAKRSGNALNSALNDGEDFELLFTLSEKDCEKLLSKWKERIRITCIGRITASRKLQIKMPDGKIRDLLPGGYDHLK
jgi:thiamine-monophosphate kinase